MAAITIYSDFGPQENKVCHCFHCFPTKWWDWMSWSSFVWMLSFKPDFPLSSFTFIKKLFSSSSLFAIRVVSSACLRLLMFLPVVLNPACASSSLAFHMMYSACKLNNQGDNIQPWCSHFPIWNQSVVPHPVLTVASWPEYRFLRWSGISICKKLFYSFNFNFGCMLWAWIPKHLEF